MLTVAGGGVAPGAPVPPEETDKIFPVKYPGVP